MNIENKKTVLGDEASIYSHDDDLSEKEKWKTMNGRQKWEYIKNYYLMKTIVALFIVAFVGSILYTMLSPKPDLVFSLAVINSAMTPEQMHQCQTEFEERIALDEKTQETCFDSGYYFHEGDYETMQRFATYNAVGQLDVTVMPESVFEQFAPAGHFASLAEKLPTDLYLELSPYLVECQLFDKNGEYIAGSETMYGIRIDGTWLYQGMELREPVILAINLSTQNIENVMQFLHYLFLTK